MKLTSLQQQVFDLAKSRLKDKPWFRGICGDSIPSDEEIQRNGVECSVVTVEFETAMWDDPNFHKSFR